MISCGTMIHNLNPVCCLIFVNKVLQEHGLAPVQACSVLSMVALSLQSRASVKTKLKMLTIWSLTLLKCADRCSQSYAFWDWPHQFSFPQRSVISTAWHLLPSFHLIPSLVSFFLLGHKYSYQRCCKRPLQAKSNCLQELAAWVPSATQQLSYAHMLPGVQKQLSPCLPLGLKFATETQGIWGDDFVQI